MQLSEKQPILKRVILGVCFWALFHVFHSEQYCEDCALYEVLPMSWKKFLKIDDSQKALTICEYLKNREISQIKIRYVYKPQNLPQQIIYVTIESPKFEKELKKSLRIKKILPGKEKEILSLQNSFRVSSNGTHNYSLDSDFQICSVEEPYSLWWDFNFFGKKKLLLTYECKSYLLELADDSLYNLIFKEALTYNKNLFKNVLDAESINLDSSQ